MRIIGGTAKGMKLYSPKGTDVRPMLDRVKEALFSILSDRVAGAAVLDLFSGTGSLGIEALSRGARSAVFVESNAACAEAIQRNLEHTHLDDRASLIRRNVLRCVPMLKKRQEAFTLALVDPPYRMTATAVAMKPLVAMLRRTAEEGLFAPDVVLMIHHGRRVFDIPANLPFEIFDERWYGQSGLALMRQAEDVA